jgi:glycosyltransferase involved in cell wall biosynthesis
MTRLVVRKADAIVAVSEVLKKSMIDRKLYNPRYYIIPNVVDTGLFIPSPGKEKKSRKRIIHVSCFEDKSKNLSGFLRTVKSLSSRRNDFECLVVGDGPDYDEIVQYSKSLGIEDSLLVFAGMKTDDDLVEAYQSSDFLVLSSNYETFGTVLIEGLSCGLPVVATRVGIVPEIITPENGLIVPPGDEDAMSEAINQMIDRIDCYDSQKIRSAVIDRFSKETVADAIYDLYREIVSCDNNLGF